MTTTDIEKATTGSLTEGFEIDREAILKSLNLNPRDANTHALILVCERYGLDPLLKHMVLIKGNPYVTRDGYLHAAHRSGQFDGMEIVDEGEDNADWWAVVAVYRKDMGRPFKFKGRYPKNGANKTFGPEMAVKTAECAALRRAFGVTGVGAAEERWDVPDTDVQVAQAVAGALPAGGADAETGEVAEPAPSSRRRPPPSSGGGGTTAAPTEGAARPAPASGSNGGRNDTRAFVATVERAVGKLGLGDDEVKALYQHVAGCDDAAGLPGPGDGTKMVAAVKAVEAGTWKLVYSDDGPAWDTGEVVQGELVDGGAS